MEYFKRESEILEGDSNHPSLQAGHIFSIEDDNILEKKDLQNQPWLVVQITHNGEQPQALEEEAVNGATTL